MVVVALRALAAPWETGRAGSVKAEGQACRVKRKASGVRHAKSIRRDGGEARRGEARVQWCNVRWAMRMAMSTYSPRAHDSAPCRVSR